MAKSRVKVGNISRISGEVNIASGNIIKNIRTIYERSLTATEEAAQARSIEEKELSKSVGNYIKNLQRIKKDHPKDTNTNPYKNLLSYELWDASSFHGRDEAIKGLLSVMDNGRLTVLYAETGAGKTSLLQAGIAPRIIAHGHLPIFLRFYNKPPTQKVKAVFLPNLSFASGLEKMSLRAFLALVCKVLGSETSLYILVDQFEEFFVRLDKQEQSAFLDELGECLEDATLKVNWLFSLRRESLGDLSDGLQVRNIRKNEYSLRRLTRDEARNTIVKPAKSYKFEKGLPDKILDDISDQNGEVYPPELQLVCSALFKAVPKDEKVITEELYKRTGGVNGILGKHLENAIKGFPTSQRKIALQVLEELVSSKKQRELKSRDELISVLTGQTASPGDIDKVLEHLRNEYLLRVVEETDEGDYIYELSHDYLLNEITLAPDVLERKQSKELLEQVAKNWDKYRILAGKDTLELIQFPRDILKLDAGQIVPLLLSLAGYKEKAKVRREYIKLVKQSEIRKDIVNELEPLVASKNIKIRENAYQVLSYFVSDCNRPVQRKVYLWNISRWVSKYSIATLITLAAALSLYGISWVVSREYMQGLDWHTAQSFERDCQNGGNIQNPQIALDPRQPSTVIVYSNTPFFICKSRDSAVSWDHIEEGLPSNTKINSIVVSGDSVYLSTTTQLFFQDLQNKDGWIPLNFSNDLPTGFQSLAIGGKNISLFISTLSSKVISIKLENECLQKTNTREIQIPDKNGCLTYIDAPDVNSKSWQSISANRDYLALGTSDGELWYTPTIQTHWQSKEDSNQQISSLILNPINIFPLTSPSEFIIVSENGKVYHGELDIPGGANEDNIFPYPGTNGDNIWDWPSNTNSVAISSRVFYAANQEGLNCLPAWSIFDPEWWRLVLNYHPPCQ